MKILGSASRIVFILLTLAACIGFLTHTLESKDFMVLSISAFSYYFGSRNLDDGGATIK